MPSDLPVDSPPQPIRDREVMVIKMYSSFLNSFKYAYHKYIIIFRVK